MDIIDWKEFWAMQFGMQNCGVNSPIRYIEQGRKLWELNKFEIPALLQDLELVAMDYNYRIDLLNLGSDPFECVAPASLLNNFVAGQKICRTFGIDELGYDLDLWHSIMQRAKYSLAPVIRDTLYALSNNSVVVGNTQLAFDPGSTEMTARHYLETLDRIIDNSTGEAQAQLSASYLRVFFQTGRIEEFCSSVCSLDQPTVSRIRITESKFILGCGETGEEKTSLDIFKEILAANPWIKEVRMKKYFPRPPNSDAKVWYSVHPEIPFSVSREEFLIKDNDWIAYDPLEKSALAIYGIFENNGESRYLFTLDIDSNELRSANPFSILMNLGIKGYLMNSGENYHFISKGLFSLEDLHKMYGLAIAEFCPELDIGKRLYLGQEKIGKLADGLKKLGKVGPLDLKYIGDGIEKHSYNIRISAAKRYISPPILVAEI
jgi:hypothetical protein